MYEKGKQADDSEGSAVKFIKTNAFLVILCIFFLCDQFLSAGKLFLEAVL